MSVRIRVLAYWYELAVLHSVICRQEVTAMDIDKQERREQLLEENKHTKARSGTYKSSSNHPSKRHNAQHLSFQFISERLSSLSSAYLNSSRGLHSRRHRRHLRLKIPVKEVSLSLLLLV